MANEATVVELTRKTGTRFLHAIGSLGTNVPVGTLMKFANPRTASASTGASDLFAGILASEHVGGQDIECAVYDDGIFEIAASGTVNAGDCLVTTDDMENGVKADNAETQKAKIVGYALTDKASDKVVARVSR
jgi:hypothetical protein